VYRVGLNHVKEIKAVQTQVIVGSFVNLDTAWHVPIERSEQIGFPPRTFENIQQTRNQLELDEIWVVVTEKDVKFNPRDNEIYPWWLKEVDKPPRLLFMRGKIKAEDDWTVDIVATRWKRVNGRVVAEDLAGQQGFRRIDFSKTKRHGSAGGR